MDILTSERYEPVSETVSKHFQMDKYGNHRFWVLNKEGEKIYSAWTPYSHIATKTVDHINYIAATAYYDGTFAIEQVLVVETTNLR